MLKRLFNWFGFSKKIEANKSINIERSMNWWTPDLCDYCKKPNASTQINCYPPDITIMLCKECDKLDRIDEVWNNMREEALQKWRAQRNNFGP